MKLRLWHPDYNFLRRDYWFGQVDSRPLSLFRIVAAMLMLKEAMYFLPLSAVFFSDNGIVPRSIAAQVNGPWRWSLLSLVGAESLVTLFLLVWIAILLCLLVGYRTRLMTVLNFIFLVSLFNRNYLPMDGADYVMRVMAFWSLFVPLGDYYSVDALRTRLRRYRQTGNWRDLQAPAAPRTMFAFPLRMMQIQIALVYVVAGVSKTGDVWMQGLALHDVLSLKTYTLPTADLIVQFAPDWLLRALTYGVLLIEDLFIVLVFVPIGQPLLRLIGLASMALMHIGIAATMGIQNFAMFMIATYLVFFDPAWVKALGAWTRRKAALPLMIGWPVGYRPAWLLLLCTANHEIRPNTDVAGNYTDYDSWWVVDGDNVVHTDAAAWLQVAACLPLSRVWGRMLTDPAVRRVVCAVLLRRASREIAPEPFPVAPTVILPPPRARWWHTAAVAIGLPVILLTIWWHMDNLQRLNLPLTPAPSVVRSVVDTIGLYQNWEFFAANPVRTDRWIVVPGQFEDNAVLNLRTGTALNYAVERYYVGPGGRWRNVANSLRPDWQQGVIAAWAQMYCRMYNEDQRRPEGSRLVRVEILMLEQDLPMPGEATPQLRPTRLLEHWCLPALRVR